MEQTVRKYPEWFGDDKEPTKKGWWVRSGMVFAYLVFGVLLAVIILSYVLSMHTLYATGGLVVVTFAWTIRNYKRIWDLVLGLTRHIRNNAFFDFTREIPSLVTPLLVCLLTLIVANPEDAIKDSGMFGGITEQFDKLENFLRTRGGPLSREDVETVVRPIVREEVAALKGTDGGESGSVSVQRFVVFPDAGSDSLVQFFGNAIFPLRFTNAQIESAPADEADFVADDVVWKSGPDGGTELTASHDADLRELIKILAPCTLDPVSLRVSGFASSLPFSEFPSVETSNKLNHAAANLRAKAVFDRLETLKSEIEDADNDNLFNPANLGLAVHYHDSFDEMISHRPFNDRPGELRENESEGLNRSAFIRIGAIGACEVER